MSHYPYDDDDRPDPEWMDHWMNEMEALLQQMELEEEARRGDR